MSAIGITNTIPWIASLPGQGGGGPTPPPGNFIALETALTDIMALETGLTDKAELEQ
tara:strand:- start:445 stop:615 length:171 start_codon:yes stop_codon:yes gene_type:complete